MSQTRCEIAGVVPGVQLGWEARGGGGVVKGVRLRLDDGSVSDGVEAMDPR